MKLQYKEYMPNRYSLNKDLHDRLEETVVRYDGHPYICRVLGPDSKGVEKLGLYDVTKWPNTSDCKTIDHDDERLDISMIELGYINFTINEKHARAMKEGAETHHRALYLLRDMKRHYKSAFHSSYMTVLTIKGDREEWFYGHKVISNQEFVDAVLGNYPSVTSVLSSFETISGICEVAVSQDVALRKEGIGIIMVYFKTKLIGWIDPDTRKLKLTNDDRRWVIERVLVPLGFNV